MSECSPLKSFLDPKALIRGTVWFGTMLVIGVYAWSNLERDVQANEKKVTQNEKNIGEINKKLNNLEQNQKLIQQQIENDQRNSAAFQMRTDTALDRIIQKLDTMKPNRWETPQ